MKWAESIGFILVSLILTTSSSLAQQHEFCWKDSYGRGVGTVPTACAPGQEMVGLLCYDKCPDGMQRPAGTVDCHSVCPPGMRDDGLFCRRAEYGRGTGYAWQFRDGFSSDGMISRCESDNGKNHCEMSGAIAYPKCRPGYSAVGCCICRPSVPDCGKLGLGGQLDLSCAKKIEIGTPKFGVCSSGSSDSPGSAEQRDAGLCYKSCQLGYTGVGPVCWKDAPSGWVNCGMGAARDSRTCAEIVFGQVAAVGQLALTAATLGSSLAVPGAGAANAGKLAELKELYKKLEAAYKTAKDNFPALAAAEKTVEAGLTAKNQYTAVSTALNVTTAEDIARVSAQIAQIVDTSGVSSTIANFTYPKCSKYTELGANN